VQTLLAGDGPVAYDFFNYAVNATGAIVGNVAVGGAGGGDAVSALYGGVNPSRRPSSSSMPTIDSASVMENTSIKCSLISITPTCRLSVSTCTPSHSSRGAPAFGSCNMSRIDNATLQLQLAKMSEGSQVSVYATNYNVLRIMSGMGGLCVMSTDTCSSTAVFDFNIKIENF
jgi:hypothetical protein